MTTTSPFAGFYQLRAAATAVYKSRHVTIPENPENWSVKDIAGFVSDVEEKTGMRISERWMYSYFKKADIERLPRTDMLDILAGYAGFDDWRAFLLHQTRHDTATKAEQGKFAFKVKRVLYMLAAVVIITVATVAGLWRTGSGESHFTVCLTDKFTGNPVMAPVQITAISGDVRRRLPAPDHTKCIEVAVNDGMAMLTVSSPYYHNDTLEVSSGRRNDTVNLALQPDAYALLIHYFISGLGNDFEERMTILHNILHEDLIAMEVDAEHGMPLHLYNKASLMRRLLIGTTPASAMKIVYLTYQNQQIYELRYMQVSTD